MKNRYLNLKAILLTATLALTGSGLTGCSVSGENNKTILVLEREATHFDIGEHILSVPILESEDVRLKNYQYEYHPGYDVVGISLTSYGQHSNNFGGGSIVYVNNEEVDCSTNLKDQDGNYVYLYFGTPINNRETRENNNEFGVGEHIISVPIMETDDNRENEVQYEYHEGYVVVGISTSAYGKNGNVFGGGVILYKNVVPVVCSLSEDGYTTFGTPIEVEKEHLLGK